MKYTIHDYAKGNDYQEFGSIYWKETDDYLVTLREYNGKISLEIQSGFQEGIMPSNIGEKVAEIAELEYVNDCIINNSSLLLSFWNDDMQLNDANELTNTLITLLKENNIPTIKICRFCDQEMYFDNKVIIKIDNKLVKTHKDCYEKFLGDIETEKERKRGNIFTGIIGALIFGAIGTIPWIVVGILGWFASILGLVISFCASFGYNLFKGREGRMKTVTVVFVLILMVVVAGFVTQLYELFSYFDEIGIEGVKLIDGIKFVLIIIREDSEFAMSFLWSSLLGIGFGVLGSWRIIKNSRLDTSYKYPTVEMVKEY